MNINLDFKYLINSLKGKPKKINEYFKLLIAKVEDDNLFLIEKNNIIINKINDNFSNKNKKYNEFLKNISIKYEEQKLAYKKDIVIEKSKVDQDYFYNKYVIEDELDTINNTLKEKELLIKKDFEKEINSINDNILNTTVSFDKEIESKKILINKIINENKKPDSYYNTLNKRVKEIQKLYDSIKYLDNEINTISSIKDNSLLYKKINEISSIISNIKLDISLSNVELNKISLKLLDKELNKIEKEKELVFNEISTFETYASKYYNKDNILKYSSSKKDFTNSYYQSIKDKFNNIKEIIISYNNFILENEQNINSWFIDTSNYIKNELDNFKNRLLKINEEIKNSTDQFISSNNQSLNSIEQLKNIFNNLEIKTKLLALEKYKDFFNKSISSSHELNEIYLDILTQEEYLNIEILEMKKECMINSLKREIEKINFNINIILNDQNQSLLLAKIKNESLLKIIESDQLIDKDIIDDKYILLNEIIEEKHLIDIHKINSMFKHETLSHNLSIYKINLENELLSNELEFKIILLKQIKDNILNNPDLSDYSYIDKLIKKHEKDINQLTKEQNKALNKYTKKYNKESKEISSSMSKKNKVYDKFYFEHKNDINDLISKYKGLSFDYYNNNKKKERNNIKSLLSSPTVLKNKKEQYFSSLDKDSENEKNNLSKKIESLTSTLKDNKEVLMNEYLNKFKTGKEGFLDIQKENNNLFNELINISKI